MPNLAMITPKFRIAPIKKPLPKPSPSEALKANIKIKEEFPHKDKREIDAKQQNKKSPTNCNSEHRTNPSIEIENILEIKMELANEHNNPLNTIQIEKETISENVFTIIPTLNLELYGCNDIGGLIYQCEFCGHTLPTKNALYKHRLRKHKNEKNFKRNFVKPSVNCSLCGKVFNDMVSLNQHKDNEHRIYACEYCGHKLPTRNALSQHRLRKHRDLKSPKKKTIQSKCSQSLESFNPMESLQTHKTKQHERKRSMAAEPNSEIKCEDCNQKLPTRNALSQHRLRKHRNKIWFKCEDCDHKLPTKNALSQHRSRKHRNKKGNGSFKCEECDYKLPTKDALSKHRIRKHRNIEENLQALS